MRADAEGVEMTGMKGSQVVILSEPQHVKTYVLEARRDRHMVKHRSVVEMGAIKRMYKYHQHNDKE
jgi:hypothetical protein